MAKRDNGAGRKKGGTATAGASAAATAGASTAATAAAVEERVLAFAKQLGRIAGALQAKAEASMRREALNTQLAKVRDGAADLLEQLAGGAAKAATNKPAATASRAANTGRSGGVVDAPGKKHRRLTPADPAARTVDSQAAKVRAAMTMAKTNRRRGRG